MLAPHKAKNPSMPLFPAQRQNKTRSAASTPQKIRG